MNHEAYENEMIDSVNRHAGEWDSITGDIESTPAAKPKVFTKTDARTLWIGFTRMILALFTATSFGLAVYSFIAVATATGYWAVILFLSAIVLTIWAFILLYVQGIIHGESKGEKK